MNPFVLCFTGTSGSGKTTLANAVAKELKEKAIPLQVIDGDILRGELGGLFGYTRDERMKQNRVVRVISKYLLGQNVNVMIAVVAPYEEMRREMRKYLGENFFLVYVQCPYETCEERDVKGYYRLSRQNQIQNLNGADDVYEAPSDAELTLDTSKNTIEFCVEQILRFLRERKYAV